jgi:type IV pilus assembly protein PilC
MAENFSYRARDRGGQVKTGEMLADSAAAVAAHIRNQGLLVLKIEAVKSGKTDLNSFFNNLRGVSLRELTIFCRQFATMVAAGLPLVSAIGILIDQSNSPLLRQALQSVYKEVQEGTALSAALAQHPLVFPKVMVYLVEAGELGGVLDEVLEQLALQFEKDYKINQKVKGAMTYPAAVLTFALMSVSGVITVILPKFVNIYKQMNAQLPLPTRILIQVSGFLRSYGLIFLAALVLGAVVLAKSKHAVGFKALKDRLILALPVFGLLYRKVAIARFTRTMGTLVRGGVPIVQALDVVKNTTDIVPMVAALDEAQISIREGYSFAAPLSRSGLFPPMVVQMVAIGEETGRMEDMLRKVAEFYENDVEDMVSRLSSLLEPFLIVVLGVVLGSVIISLMLPMFDMATKIH